ncbi:MAG: hypothetical protein ORN57_04485, partial [Alphaproteobacteria bacterium]|nr:hypothetical protein [Alphaproteobacteria bacterium]
MVSGALLAVALWCGFGSSVALAWRYNSQVSLVVHYYKYQENTPDGSFFISNDGPMIGVNYRGQFAFANGIFVEPIDISLYGSKSISYKSKFTGTSNDDSYLVVEARATGGYSFRFSDGGMEKNHTVKLYTGLGYRYTGNFGEGKFTSTGAFTYNRINHLGYLPLGVAYYYDKDKWSVGVKAEYDIFLGGQQLSYSQLQYFKPDGDAFASPSKTPLVNRQRAGYGAKFDLSLGYNGWTINPFFNYWKINASDPLRLELPLCNNTGSICSGSDFTTLFEPANTTIEVGAR